MLESNSIDDGYVTITKRTMNDQSMNLLSECIAGHNWETIKSIDSVEEVYNTFIGKLKELYDHNCPLKTVKVKKLDISKSYINNNVKLLIKEKHLLQRFFNKKPLAYGNQYRAAPNHLNAVIRTAKSKYFQSKIRNI